MNTKLLLAEHRQVIRAGLKSFIARSRIEVVGEASRGRDVLQLIRKHSPGILLIGRLSDENGLTTLRRVRKKHPRLSILMCFTDDNPTFAARSYALGANGCFSIGAPREELLAALEEVAAGRNAWSEEQIARLTGSPAVPKDVTVRLTPREREVLRQLAFGLPNREIGQMLGISVETVKEHVASIRQKLGVSDRTKAAVWAVRHGLD